MLEALSPLRTLEEAPSPAEAFPVNSFSFLGMELIAGIFQKRKPGESHFSLNVERKQRPRLRAKSEWPGAPQPRLSQSGLHSLQSAPVTGLACLSLLQKTLPWGSSRQRALHPVTGRACRRGAEDGDRAVEPSINLKGRLGAPSGSGLRAWAASSVR